MAKKRIIDLVNYVNRSFLFEKKLEAYEIYFIRILPAFFENISKGLDEKMLLAYPKKKQLA